MNENMFYISKFEGNIEVAIILIDTTTMNEK